MKKLLLPLLGAIGAGFVVWWTRYRTKPAVPTKPTLPTQPTIPARPTKESAAEVPSED